MRRSKVEIHLHLVWTTWRRAPLLHGDIRRIAYRGVQSEIQKLGGAVVAIGGMPDHVHVLVKMPATLSASRLAKQAKGASSRAINEAECMDDLFRWQSGYGVFSISRSHVKRVQAYITDQEQHHRDGSLWSALEAVAEGDPGL